MFRDVDAEAEVRFAVEGLGTPAPIAPPKRLVVGGLPLSPQSHVPLHHWGHRGPRLWRWHSRSCSAYAAVVVAAAVVALVRWSALAPLGPGRGFAARSRRGAGGPAMNALALMVACERAQRTYELPPGRRSTTGERITLRGAHPPVLALPATDGELVDERRQLPDPFRPAVQRPAAPFEVLDAEERIALRPAAV